MNLIAENYQVFIGLIGSVVAYFGGKKMKEIEEKKANSDALQGIQAVYEKFVEQTNEKFEEMQKEIQTLRQELKLKVEQCKNCTK